MENTLAAQFTVSDTGALIYVTGGVLPAIQRSLAWVDRKGTSQPLSAPARAYRTPRLSPDGRHVAAFIQEGIRQVWSYDIARGALSAVTVDGRSSYGIFAPDQKRIAFRSGVAGAEDNLYWKAADGSGSAERLTTSTRNQTPGSWSPDGTAIAFVEEGDSPGQTQVFQFDVWVLSIGDRKTRALIQTAANEMSPEFSPDGRWLAYVSNQSGRHEVYVQPYPGPGERHLISTNGGFQPAWSGNGRELFYAQAAQWSSSGPMTLMSVSIETTPTFVAGTPKALFESLDLASAWGRNYDVAPDGQRFLMAREHGAADESRTGSDDLRAELVRGAEAPRADEVAHTSHPRYGNSHILAESRLARHVGCDDCSTDGARCVRTPDVLHQPGLVGHPDSLSLAGLQHDYCGRHRAAPPGFALVRWHDRRARRRSRLPVRTPDIAVPWLQRASGRRPVSPVPPGRAWQRPGGRASVLRDGTSGDGARVRMCRRAVAQPVQPQRRSPESQTDTDIAAPRDRRGRRRSDGADTVAREWHLSDLFRVPRCWSCSCRRCSCTGPSAT